jgi:hypothetical protein
MAWCAHHPSAGPGSSTDKVSQGRWCEHCGGGGNTPDKVAAVGAHQAVGQLRGGRRATTHQRSKEAVAREGLNYFKISNSLKTFNFLKTLINLKLTFPSSKHLK